MRTETSSRVQRAKVLLAIGLCAAACGDAQSGSLTPSTTAEAAELTGHVHVYWTDVDENNNAMTREKVITQEQKQALLAARTANRVARHTASTRASDGTADDHEVAVKRTITATVGSTDWQSACQYYSWILLTSGADGTGDIFCATYVPGNVNPRAVSIPFMPSWYDGSTDYYGLLCTGADYCRLSDDCGFWGRDVWGTLTKSGRGNLGTNPATWIRAYPDCPFSGW